jgi:hypothetical protein
MTMYGHNEKGGVGGKFPAVVVKAVEDVGSNTTGNSSLNSLCSSSSSSPLGCGGPFAGVSIAATVRQDHGGDTALHGSAPAPVASPGNIEPHNAAAATADHELDASGKTIRI